MRLLINTSTLKGTGVTQVAVSFINECKAFDENEYVVFLSPYVANNISQESFPSNFTFYKFGKYSLYGLIGKLDLYRMKRLEARIKPDVVFSVFGPSLWRPRAPHLMGYPYPHYVYEELPIFKHMSFKTKFGVRLRKFIHINQLKRNGDYLVSETKDVSNRLHMIYNFRKEKVFTVSNTVNSFFLNYKQEQGNRTNHDNSLFKFYSLCAPMPHKNLDILNKVIPLLLNKTKSKIRFYVTISDEAYQRMFNKEIQKYVYNVGPLKVADCPSFVDSCDALFLPTLLECFSASYPEAMLMGKPILTSDLPFATTVCEDAALYFDPYNPVDIAEKIISLVESRQLYNLIQKKGYDRFEVFPTPTERALKYLKICANISNCKTKRL